MKELSNKTYRILKYVLFLIGSFLLIYQYAINASMWTDEAKLALNVIDLTFLELTQPLQYYQSAPILFLWASKLFTYVFGNTDYALRATPLILGMISLPLFFSLISKITQSRFWSIIGFTLFITNFNLIYYSSEFKQYIGDLFSFLLIFSLVLSEKKWIQNNKGVILGITGSILLYFSNASPILFITAVIYICYNHYILHKNIISGPNEIYKMITIFGSSIIIFYIHIVNNNPLKEYMITFWDFSFPPHPLLSKEFFYWIIEYPWLQIIQALHFPPPWFYSIVIVSFIGFLSKRNWKVPFLLFTTILIHISLSYLQVYPFFERFLLYTIPLIILFLITGLQNLSERLRIYPKVQVGLNVVLSLFVVGYLGFTLIGLKPTYREEIKPALEIIRVNKKPSDLTYVYYGSKFSFLRYKDLHHISKFIIGQNHRNDNNEYEKDLTELLTKNDRVWFVFSHIYPWNEGQPEDDVFYQFLQQKGSISYDNYYTNARVFLFQKSN